MKIKEIETQFDLLEVYEIVGSYEIVFGGEAPTIKIDIRKDRDGNYWGISNYTVNGYRSLYPKESPESALKDAINGIKFAYKKDGKDKWKKVENE